MQKNNLNEFLMVEFKEHPVVDFLKNQATSFDVSAEGDTDYPADFMDGHLFKHEQYCICLLKTAFALSCDELPDFLDYQCRKVRLPWLWLSQFETLLRRNLEYGLDDYSIKEVDGLVKILKKKRIQYFGLVRYDKDRSIDKLLSPFPGKTKFNIINVRDEMESIEGFEAKGLFLERRKKEYLQEQEHNAEADFIKSVDLEIDFMNIQGDQNGDLNYKTYVFKGPPIQLAFYFARLVEERNEKDILLFDGAKTDLAKIICLVFRREDGSSFSENSIRKYLTDYFNGGKRWIDNDFTFRDN